MSITFIPYQLRFKYPFKIAHGIRTHTNVVYVKLEHEGYTAWGEATLPPYLPETQKSVIEFLTAFGSSVANNPLEDWFQKLSADTSANMAAKAALDMALWDLKAQMQGKTVSQLLGITSTSFPLCTYTIGICSLNEMKQKIEDANEAGFEIFKLKLDGAQDKEVISNFKSLSKKPFAVDVNQGWKSVNEAVEKTQWLSEEGCVLVEQLLPKEQLNEMKEVKGKSTLPLYADESCHRLSDLEHLRESFDGINIKLMKCGGITEAFQMIKRARELELKILIGCMSESSVGCSAAANLAPLADYTDLDGPYLIANDPFEGMKVEKGRIKLHPLNSKNAF